jgi:AraC family transcriptional regulator
MQAMSTNFLRRDSYADRFGTDSDPSQLLQQTGLSVPGDRRSSFTNQPATHYSPSTQTQYYRGPLDEAEPIVEMSPPDAVTQRVVIADGVVAEIVHATRHARFAFRFRAPVHVLVVYEQGVRREGETFIEGLSRSTLRDFARRLTFVPAGCEYREWQEPRTPARLMFVYFNPAQMHRMFDTDSGDVMLSPKLFFEDATLLDTALKLKRMLEASAAGNSLYLQALAVLLVHELVQFNRGTPGNGPHVRGGLAGWQQRAATAHIEAHLGEHISLVTLAQLVHLSPYYFCRAFKRSFGVPPHRYHTNRRIEHAKELLATRAHSVTDIGLTVGYSETSSFTAVFRKATGLTPSAYQRSFAKGTGIPTVPADW